MTSAAAARRLYDLPKLVLKEEAFRLELDTGVPRQSFEHGVWRP